MKFFRHFRIVAALIALWGMLFTQLAVAAYVCPSMQIGNVMASVAAASGTGMEHHDMSNCHGVTQEKSAVCHHYSQGGNQSLDKPESPNVTGFSPAVFAGAVSFYALSENLFIPSADSRLLTRITSPPLAIQHCCFRI